MYRQRVPEDSIEVMTNLLWNMPIDVVDSFIMTAQDLQLDEMPRDHLLYSDIGVLIHRGLEDGGIGALFDRQRDKPFYIPSAHQIDEIYRMGYEDDAPAYQRLLRFLMDKAGLAYGPATVWCQKVWTNSYYGDKLTDIVQEMTEEDVILWGEAQAQEFINIVMDAHNSTRMIDNRGHRPTELHGHNQFAVSPTIVPGSSEAADMLGRKAPALRDMGMPLDLDSNADMITTFETSPAGDGTYTRVDRKIYPNDPCPCGSGKKYKKCCGRR